MTEPQHPSATLSPTHKTMAYVDTYVMLVVLFTGLLLMLPWLRRVRMDQTGPRKPPEKDGRVEGLPAAAE